MAILTEQVIQELGLIQNADPGRYRSIGYDLTVGTIYVPEDDEQNLGPREATTYEIPPHGIVMIFSREWIDVPQGVCGYAMPKTRLCEEGILVLNTGVVDPTYRGPISGTAVNFRKTAYRLNQGDPFLRLVFEDVGNASPRRSVPSEPVPPSAVDAYRNERMVRAQQYGASFLNLRTMMTTVARTVTSDLLERDRRFFGLTVAGVALLFTVLQVLPSVVPRLTFSEEAMRAKLLQDLQATHTVETAALKAQLEVHRTLIDHLRQRLEQQTGNNQGSRTAPARKLE